MNELQLELKNQLEKYRLQKIEPHMEHDDEIELFRMDVFNELGSLGFTGMTLPEEYGGMGLTYEDFTVALTEIAKSSVAYAVTISVS
ncbi:MAG: acyl-CoA dehydrogenase family protein, partial [Bacteriovorax sp.]